MTSTAATLRDQILEEINDLPVKALAEVLTYVQRLRNGPNVAPHDEVWQAHLESEKEREEVYRRLAGS
ncbi:MAG: DUF2281 domain-containing protein [Nodosilinea sp. WJT8-NPBG4]|jgi:hypothetical protein|nr:DUF2281 domain-containing protein [Nodosilinea sp. WJT8-NPBG4]